MGQFRIALRWKFNRQGSSQARAEFYGTKRREKEEGRYYHWYDEPKLAHVTVDSSYLRGIMERGIRESGYHDIKSFLKEKVSNRSDRTLYRNLINRQKTTMNVCALKRFCERFKIGPDEIERLGMISQPHPYPIDMKCRGFLKMKTHALNEGTITQKRLLIYSNQDPVMLKHFADAVKESGGPNLKEVILGHRSLEIFANSVLGRGLEASGLPRGKKTISNPSLDPQIARDSAMTRYHVQATLNEEGGFYLTISKQRRVYLGIAWGRSVDITDGLTSMQVDELRRIEEEHGSKIPIRRIKDSQIREVIEKSPPLLLDQELALLEAYHPEKEWPEAHPSKIHISKEARATAYWEVRTHRPDLIDIFHDEYGLMPGTWKAERFERLYQAYVKYRGRQLTDKEIQEVRKIKEENPADISIDWISRKTQELFPDIEWGKDVDEIRRKIERKK